MKSLPGEFLPGLLSAAGISLPPGAVEKLLLHADLMLRWNRAIRLTAITAPEEVAVKHILDSLLLLDFGPFTGRTLDFGSGGGYPGIPLAIAVPESRVVLLESSGKKCAFLSHLKSVLDLPNVEVIQGRLTSRHPLPAGRFEQIVTRATLPPEEAVPLLFPFLEPGGRLLLMTGPGKDDSLEPAGDPAARRDEFPLPAGGVRGRRRRFTLPLGKGVREIREILSL